MFHRDSNSLTAGEELDIVTLIAAWVICDGDRKFCENPDAYCAMG